MATAECMKLLEGFHLCLLALVEAVNSVVSECLRHCHSRDVLSRRRGGICRCKVWGWGCLCQTAIHQSCLLIAKQLDHGMAVLLLEEMVRTLQERLSCPRWGISGCRWLEKVRSPIATVPVQTCLLRHWNFVSIMKRMTTAWCHVARSVEFCQHHETYVDCSVPRCQAKGR